jgi:RND superfamily putative drug exporter
VVTLLGDRAWSLPPWLDRILPNVSLEGHLVQGMDERLTQEEDDETTEASREAAVSSSGSPR